MKLKLVFITFTTLVLLLASNVPVYAVWEDTGIPDSAYFLEPIIYYTDCSDTINIDLPIYLAYDEYVAFFWCVLYVPLPPEVRVTGIEYTTPISSGVTHSFWYWPACDSALRFEVWGPGGELFPPYSGQFFVIHLRTPNDRSYSVSGWEGGLFVSDPYTRSFAPTYIDLDIEFEVAVEYPDSGDIDCSGVVEVSDVVFLIEYIFNSGDPPYSLNSADVDHSCIVEVSDAVYLIQFIFNSGPAPLEGCVF